MVRQKRRDHEHLAYERGADRPLVKRGRVEVDRKRDEATSEREEAARRRDGEERPAEALEHHEPLSSAEEDVPKLPRKRRARVQPMARDAVRHGHRSDRDRGGREHHSVAPTRVHHRARLRGSTRTPTLKGRVSRGVSPTR
eukprot:30937-Pelagococcus_subviridis.AAC.9